MFSLGIEVTFKQPSVRDWQGALVVDPSQWFQAILEKGHRLIRARAASSPRIVGGEGKLKRRIPLSEFSNDGSEDACY